MCTLYRILEGQTWNGAAPTAPPTVATHYCGSVVGLGQDPHLLASLHRDPEPQSRGDCLFWGPGCVCFPSHPVHFQGLEQQGQVSLWGYFQPVWPAWVGGRWSERVGSAMSGGGRQWRGTPLPKGQAGVLETWKKGQESLTAPHVPPLTSGGITKALGDAQKSLPARAPGTPL